MADAGEEAAMFTLTEYASGRLLSAAQAVGRGDRDSRSWCRDRT